MSAAPSVHVDRHERATPGEFRPVVADGFYDAALESLLAHAIKTSGRLDGLMRLLWTTLTRHHSRRRDGVNRLLPEYWFRFS